MPEVRSQRSWLLVASYLAFLSWLPLLVDKQDREVRWHAKNGLLLFGAVAAFAVLTTLVGILVPPLSCLYGIVMLFLLATYAVVVVLAIVKALQGERLMVPGISRYADRF